MMRGLLAFLAGLSGAVLAAAMLLSVSVLPAQADATSDKAALDQLFAQLKVAPDADTARALDQQIWRIWMVPADVDLAGRMGAVLAAEQAGDLEAALDLLGKMVVQNPDYAEGWNQRATVEYELQDFTDSLADIDKVLALEPRHFGALSGRALIYLAEGNRAKALQAIMAALALHPFLAEKALFPELSTPATQI